MGRIVLLLLYFTSSLFLPLSAGGVRSAKLDQEAMEYESKAKLENDPIKKKNYTDLAKVRREEATNERKSHFINRFDPSAKDSNSTLQRDSTLHLSENTAIEGTWELTFGLGSGLFTSTRGQEILKSPEMIALAGGIYFNRTSPNYDNFEYYNSYQNKSNYFVNPVIAKLKYTHNADKFGFLFENRGFSKDTSYQSWSPLDINSEYTAFQESNYYWSDIKFNYFYHEGIGNNQSFQFLFGLRLEGASIDEKAILPNSSRYREYKETSATLGPNLGINYKKNFFEKINFTIGVELSLGGGSLSYDSLVLRKNSDLGLGSNFSKMEMKDPILIGRTTIEAYTKFDLLITEKNRLGIGFTYLQGKRTTNWDQKIPVILSNDIDQLVLDYFSFVQRNALYNLESNSDSTRSQYLRMIQLEYSYVF